MRQHGTPREITALIFFIVSMWFLFMVAPFAFGAPRGRIAGRGPVAIPVKPAFDPASMTAPGFGWAPYMIERYPETGAVWRVTITTQDTAPWGDQAWLRSHPRYANGSFGLPIYRHRQGSWCRIGYQEIEARPNFSLTFIIDTSSVKTEDTVFFESWAGYSTWIEILKDGVVVATLDAGPRISTDQPYWEQMFRMRCD